MGTRLIEDMFDRCNFDFERKDIQMIKDIIEGKLKNRHGVIIRPEYWDIQWAFEIVNNKWNSIDVDKFDYLWRDCESIGLKHQVEFHRLVSSAWVIGNSIAYDINEQESVFNLF